MSARIPEERRLAACAELADLIKLMSDGVGSLSKRLVYLAQPGQDRIEKAAKSLRRYREFDRLPCQAEVAAIEARLLGLPVEEVGEADRLRMEREAAIRAQRDLLHDGYCEASQDERDMLYHLRGLPKEEAERIVALISSMAFSYRPSRRRKARKAKAASANPAPRTKVFPFEVITGGVA